MQRQEDGQSPSLTPKLSVISVAVLVVCTTRLSADPCHRLVFIVSDWLEQGLHVNLALAYILRKCNFLLRKTSNTGEFPRAPLPNCCEFLGKLSALYIPKMDSP